MNAPESTEESECCVRVAVRIRPQNSREKIDLCRICTAVTAQEPQIVLGLDKAFTYDYVFDVNSKQEDIYTACIGKLVEGALKGYNGTVLAYGQTGSGKTFTMGTGFECDPNDNQIGIIPRAVNHIFAGINEIEQKWKETYNGYSSQFMIQFSVAVQFIELYNEDIIDLLDPYNKVRSFKIVENGNHEISITGATIKPVQSPMDALKYLQQGALARTTASTKMNDQSSRSHALFSVLIKRQQILPGNDLETLTSKFNFVDLAGSERLKRTGATGERAREGISINCGLLALGNCISALGDLSKKATHIPYRDSKLTRLLQDSLGGNSQTMMIACISPSDRDFMETLNTLKYANRARNIKNKIQINQDQNSRTICQLRREIAALQLEILDYKQGKRNTDAEGNSLVSDTFYENVLLLAENKRLQGRLKSLQETVNILTEKNIQLKIEKEVQGWAPIDNAEPSITNLIAGYLTEIEHLQSKLIESEGMYKHLKKSCAQPATPRCTCKLNNDYTNPVDLINMAKLEIEKDREIIGNKTMEENTIALNDKDDGNFEDSDTELDQKTHEIENDLNNINSDIEIKSRLIEQLELSQQRIEVMRQHYEEKLSILSIKILNTEKERDEVLTNLVSKQGNSSNDNVKKVREDYERKISDMQRELRRLQQAQKEHARQQREMDMQHTKIRKLRADLDELKCIKTRLMRKIADQNSRHKEEEGRRVREIAKLRKEQRRSLNIVKSLQAKMLAKEQILKRKTEEVTALRKSQHGHLSRKAAGRTPAKDVKITLFNKEAARQRFDEIFKSIKWVARNKQLLMQFEKELEKLVNDRDSLSRHLSYIRNQQNSTKCIDLINEEDSIKSNLKYVHENIALVQQSIMECEDGKDAQNSSETQSFQELLNNIQNIEEAKYLLEHLIDCVVSLSCSFSLMENRVQEQVALLKEAQQETAIQQQILQHLLVHNNAVNITDLMYSLNTCADLNFCRNRFSCSNTSLHSNETYDLPPNEGNFLAFSKISSRSSSPGPTVDLSVDNNSKIRRRTAKAQDLLFGNTNQNIVSCSYVQDVNNRSMVPLVRVPSAPGSYRVHNSESDSKQMYLRTHHGNNLNVDNN